MGLEQSFHNDFRPRQIRPHTSSRVKPPLKIHFLFKREKCSFYRSPLISIVTKRSKGASVHRRRMQRPSTRRTKNSLLQRNLIQAGFYNYKTIFDTSLTFLPSINLKVKKLRLGEESRREWFDKLGLSSGLRGEVGGAQFSSDRPFQKALCPCRGARGFLAFCCVLLQ